MNIAIISADTVVDVALFDDIGIARAFLDAGLWLGADDVRPIPDGFGIGDLFDPITESWLIAPERLLPIHDSVPDPEPDIDYDSFLIDMDYRVSLLELTGGDSF